MKKLTLVAFNISIGFLALFDSFFRFLFKGEKIILCYHNVSSEPRPFEDKYQLNHLPEELRRHLKILSNYFPWGNPKELIAGSGQVGTKIYLTFDDGFKGILTEGLAVLRDFKAPSLHFLNMGPILGVEPYWVVTAEQGEALGLLSRGTKGGAFLGAIPKDWQEKYTSNEDWKTETVLACPELASLSDLLEADTDELVFFGNHLFNHFNAAKLEVEELELLFNKNKEALSSFKSTVDIFAYPFGQPGLTYDQETTRIIYKLGAKTILSACGVSNQPNQTNFFNRFTLGSAVDTKYKMKKSLIGQKIRGSLLLKFGKIDRSLVYP